MRPALALRSKRWDTVGVRPCGGLSPSEHAEDSRASAQFKELSPAEITPVCRIYAPIPFHRIAPLRNDHRQKNARANFFFPAGHMDVCVEARHRGHENGDAPVLQFYNNERGDESMALSNSKNGR